MASPSTCLILLLLFTLLVSFSSEAAPTYSSHVCDNTTTFTPNSTYKANINTLLSSLSSHTSSNKNGFYNTTAGQGSDLVYGTFLCRGDVSADLCLDCVASASKDIAKRCVEEKTGVIWYDECTVRYSDENIFSTNSEVPIMDNSSSLNINDKDRFSQLLASVMNFLAKEAPHDDQSGKKFATGEAKFTISQTLYSLVQCSPDLTAALCFRCLQAAIASIPLCCDGKQGGRVWIPTCNIRFEVFPFYRLNGTGNLLDFSPPPSNSTNGKRKIPSPLIITAIVVPVAFSLVLLALGLLFLRMKAKKYNALPEEIVVVETIIDSETWQFDLETIEAAVNNFSPANKIGEGGFGEVYQGKLYNGQMVAVKRLSKSSGQGAVEFENEVALLAKLQHRNLVRLLGFCLDGHEKLLIYEYMPNKSLDHFLFNPERQGNLDWTRRYKIIRGIARGLLYLHEDSRLKIIHRDLKASNILLDEDMNAKISDFGMAKIFDVDQTQATTRRIIGTYGYMSPEYAMRGQFSTKSDVFSFGVLILEIITGKRNCFFKKSDGADSLISYCWQQWRGGSCMDLIDSNLGGKCTRNEVVKCLHVALLCVEEDPTNRPTMTRVLLMLDSYTASMPVPHKPSKSSSRFGSSPAARGKEQSHQSSTSSTALSYNEVSITELEPR